MPYTHTARTQSRTCPKGMRTADIALCARRGRTPNVSLRLAGMPVEAGRLIKAFPRISPPQPPRLRGVCCRGTKCLRVGGSPCHAATSQPTATNRGDGPSILRKATSDEAFRRKRLNGGPGPLLTRRPGAGKRAAADGARRKIMRPSEKVASSAEKLQRHGQPPHDPRPRRRRPPPANETRRADEPQVPATVGPPSFNACHPVRDSSPLGEPDF